MAQFEGKLVFWNSEKGYGFIKPKLGGNDIFVHIRDLRCKFEDPLIGDSIFYDVKQDDDSKPRAFNAYVKGAKFTVKPKAISYPNIFAFFLLAAIPFLLSLHITKTTYYPLITYSFASILCFFLYFIDKRKAINGSWRVPEKRLHLLEFIGGWPGALIAQQTLRHKTRKLSFQFIFWTIVALHFVGWNDYLFFNLRLFTKIRMIIGVY